MYSEQMHMVFINELLNNITNTGKMHPVAIFLTCLKWPIFLKHYQQQIGHCYPRYATNKNFCTTDTHNTECCSWWHNDMYCNGFASIGTGLFQQTVIDNKCIQKKRQWKWLIKLQQYTHNTHNTNFFYWHLWKAFCH